MLHSYTNQTANKKGILKNSLIVKREHVQQNLPMTNHLKQDLMAELVKMHKHALSTVLPFTKYASLNLGQQNPN